MQRRAISAVDLHQGFPASGKYYVTLSIWFHDDGVITLTGGAAEAGLQTRVIDVAIFETPIKICSVLGTQTFGFATRHLQDHMSYLKKLAICTDLAQIATCNIEYVGNFWIRSFDEGLNILGSLQEEALQENISASAKN